MLESRPKMLLSIVVPVYNEIEVLPSLLAAIRGVMAGTGHAYEIILVDDGSLDGTSQALKQAATTDAHIKALFFSRNFGHQAAITAGLDFASGDAAVVIDADLQDPPELIPQLIARWREGFDVVYAQRRNRKGETWLKRVVSSAGYKLINKIADVDIPPNTGDFRLISRRVVDEINSMKESHGFLRGMVAVIGFRQTSVLFDRPARFEGTGKYNRFLGSLRIGLNGIFCFSNYALSISSKLGFLIAGSAFLLALVYLILKLIGTPFPLGNPTIVILLLFLGGVQLITVGILGEYIGRIYEEIRQRPKFIVDRKEGL